MLIRGSHLNNDTQLSPPLWYTVCNEKAFNLDNNLIHLSIHKQAFTMRLYIEIHFIYLGAAKCIISIAQHARPNIIGHNEPYNLWRTLTFGTAMRQKKHALAQLEQNTMYFNFMPVTHALLPTVYSWVSNLKIQSFHFHKIRPRIHVNEKGVEKL